MICNMCGSTNEVGAKFCSRCGHVLQNNDNKIEDNVHNSVIRRSIKKDAKLKNKHALYGAIAMLIGIPYCHLCSILLCCPFPTYAKRSSFIWNHSF